MELFTELFTKNYDGESIVDMFRDVREAFDTRFNKNYKEIPTDEHGFRKGTFTVTITWNDDDDS